ncbi:MAG: protein kinase domain-containing protein [Gammaproteobacteria bacterium]
MATQLLVSTGQCSDAGRRPRNEDFHGIHVPSADQLATKGIAAAIADGVSSCESGQEASGACVVGFLEDYFSTPDSWSVQKAAQKVLSALNAWLYSQGQRTRDSGRGLLTTFSAVVLKSTTAHFFHVGDSRIYRLRDGDLERLTTDHQTFIGPGPAFLSRALGADVSVEIDYRKLPVVEGDIFVLTTDGVHGYLDDKAISRVIRAFGMNLDTAATEIVRAALANGSPDNATCQIVRIDALPFQRPEEVYQELTELPFPPPLSAGMTLDGYRIIREVHASSRSQIYLAIDNDTGRQVALKTPSVNYEDDLGYIDRFVLEEWVGRRIDNPHVAKVYVPTRACRFLYYVTEYLQGVTLRQWMHDRAERRLEEVRKIIEQIARGLQAFHRLEMLHRDLKPENVMIDYAGHVKLVDFGSTRVSGIAEITTPIERVGLLGTRNYCAPEYFRNEPGTTASDVYSLGVIAYELLTAALPYGEMPLDAGRSPRRLAYTPATDRNPGIPRWVDGALRKAVHRDPKRRYQEVSELVHDLRHPNAELIDQTPRPLLERNPAAFWRTTTIVLLALVFFLLSRLAR